MVEAGFLWDEHGNFKFAFLEKFEFGTNNEVELQNLINGIKLCKMLEFLHIIIESDSKLLVGCMRKNLCPSWYL